MLTIGEQPEIWKVGRILEQRAAERPDFPVMHAEGEDYTYGWLNREANRVAAGLEAQGIAPGTRVAVMMQNTPAHVCVWFGTAKLGVVEVPINTSYLGDFLAHQVRVAGPTVAVIDAGFADRFVAIPEAASSIRRFATTKSI